MVVVMRLNVSDADKIAFKEMLGTTASRKAIIAAVTKNFERMLYPDGKPKEKAKKFTLRKS